MAAILLLEVGTIVDIDYLVALMWDRPPASARGNLRTYAHHIRARLAGTTAGLHGSPTRGYRLDPGEVAVDLADFHAATAIARGAAKACDHHSERRQLDRATMIWSGPLAADATGSGAFTQTIDALSLARIDTEEALLAARLACGDIDGLTAAVTAFLSRHPWRDRAWELLMHTYLARGDAPAALQVFQRYRRTRQDELGLDPAEQLSALHLAILTGRPVSVAHCCRPPADHRSDHGQMRATGRTQSVVSPSDRAIEEPRMAMSVESLTEFAAAVTPRLVRSAYLLTGDLAAAEDLVQEALLRALRHGHRASVGGALESYTRTTMYRLQVSAWRRRRFRTVDHALARLPPRQRAVVVLRFFEDASVTETAEILQCGVGTVKSQTSKALAKLRVLMPPPHSQPEGA
jgi:DNA-directed RNA polymerase specialized sigma24 family protein/DNA-binding SARP family transcriptional activator